MQNTSALYQTIISGQHWKEVKAVIGGTTYGMDKLASVQTQRAAFGSGTPQIGIAVAGQARITMRGVSSESIPRMAKIQLYVRVCNATQQSEWLQKGTYFVDTRTAGTGNYLQIDAYDAMLKAEQMMEWPEELVWPLEDIELVEMIAQDALGVSVDSRTYTLMNQGFEIPVPSPDEYTCREMLGYLAALYGGSFIINDMNRLQLICLWDKPEETFYLLIDPEGTGRVLIGGDRIILAARP